MLTRKRDFPQTILYLFRSVDMRGGNICHPHNSVHRRPDIMRHPGKKIRLFTVSDFCRLQCRLQLLWTFFQLLLQFLLFNGFSNINKGSVNDRDIVNFLVAEHTADFDPGAASIFKRHPADTFITTFPFQQCLFNYHRHFFILFRVLRKIFAAAVMIDRFILLLCV